MKTTIMFLMTLLVFSCSNRDNVQQKEMGDFKSDPENMPATRTLYSPIPVLLVRVEATKDGYIATPFRATGVPSPTIHAEGDVMLKALDEQGRAVSIVAVDNPRAIRTAGSTKPDTGELDKATFTVTFAKPDNIRSVEITVIGGPNAGLKQALRIEPRELKPLPDEK
ncbi:MAG: hypothetical protein KF749_14415 [Bacteroidetes bacterium]|nr:hypothetical protein [Bacteroidota bacterium]MCW5895696.1 hypothetical protein [Bacteroidota bacterium]